MPQYTGQILRILGLVIEMFGLSSFAFSARAGAAEGRGWFGLTNDQIWTIVIVGFVIWLTGTIMVQAASPRGWLANRRRIDRDDH